MVRVLPQQGSLWIRPDLASDRCAAAKEIDAINNRSALPTDNKRELLAVQVANELLADKGLSEATYAAAEDAFTTEELVTLVARVGSFSMTCCTANAFDITPPDEAPSRLNG